MVQIYLVIQTQRILSTLLLPPNTLGSGPPRNALTNTLSRISQALRRTRDRVAQTRGHAADRVAESADCIAQGVGYAADGLAKRVAQAAEEAAICGDKTLKFEYVEGGDG